MANGFSLADIVNAAAQLSTQQRQQTEQIADLTAQQGQIAANQAELLHESARLMHGVRSKELQGELEATNAARRNATSLGTNAQSDTEIITSVFEQMRADLLAFQTADARVQQIESNSNLLGNPLGWLNDLLNGDQARAERDALASRHQQSAQMLGDMFALTDSNVQTQLNLAETQDESTIRMLADAEAAEAAANAEQKNLESLQYAAASIDTLRQYGAEEFNRRMAVNSALRQESQFQQSMAMQRAQFEQQQRRIALEEAENESWETTVRNVNIAERAMGIPETDAASIRRQYGNNTPRGEAIRDLEYRGWVAANQEREAYIADNPAEARTVIARYGANLPPAATPALEILDTAARQLSSVVREVSADLMGATTRLGLNSGNVNDQEALAAAFNQIARGLAETRAENRAAIPLPLPAIMREFPALAQSELGQTVLAPLVESGVTEVDANQIFTTTAQLYATNGISFNGARDGLVEFFNDALAMEGAYNWFPQLGLPTSANFISQVTEREPRERVGGVLDTTWGYALSPLAALTVQSVNNRGREGVSARRNLTDPTDVTAALNAFKSSTLGRQMRESSQE